METRCENCKYFESREVTTPFRVGTAQPVTKKVERCRRYPPTGLGNGSDFPSAKPNEWCGEFIPKTGDYSLTETAKGAGDSIILDNLGKLDKQLTEEAAKENATDSSAGVQSQPSGVGANIPKKRGRPAKAVQKGSAEAKKAS